MGRMERRTPEEKLGLVRNVQRISRQVVQAFEGDTLDFNEPAGYTYPPIPLERNNMDELRTYT